MSKERMDFLSTKAVISESSNGSVCTLDLEKFREVPPNIVGFNLGSASVICVGGGSGLDGGNLDFVSPTLF